MSVLLRSSLVMFALFVIPLSSGLHAQTNSACGGSANNRCECFQRFICDGSGNCNCELDRACAETNCSPDSSASPSNRRLEGLGRTRGAEIPKPPLMVGERPTPTADDGRRIPFPVLDGKVHLLESIRTCERDLTSDTKITVVTMFREHAATPDSKPITKRYTAFLSDPVQKEYLKGPFGSPDCRSLADQLTAPPSTHHAPRPNNEKATPPTPSLSCVSSGPQVHSKRADGFIREINVMLQNSCNVCARVTYDFLQNGESQFPLGGNASDVPGNSSVNVKILPTMGLGSKEFKIVRVNACN